ncbi:MAG: galactokinase [Prevotella histicola]|nr:galactokinase [Prevotella histicola]MBF1391433.1 galactokinase [Prevotella histicola]
MDIEFVRSRFIKHFDGKTGNIYFSPGRINLIGEHTDYNGGFVFPGAVDKGIMAEVRPNGTDTVMCYSIDLKDRVEFKVADPEGPRATWARFIYGMVQEFKGLGVDVKGFNIAFAGDVPLGAGMSSSAAMESCFGCALNDLFADNKISKWDIALAGQATEHKYIGVNCGIMDQFASVFGQKGKLMRLDCRSREFEYFPFNPQGYKLVLVNSKVKHELAGSPYNDRRKSCENVVVALSKHFTNKKFETLRDANWEELEVIKGNVSAEDYQRAHFVLGEKDRVLAVCDALIAGDYETVGKKMYETHQGLSKEYEVSCEELDFLNEVAKDNGVTGSRIMGGGFGGCTINLVKDEIYDKFITDAMQRFEAKYGHAPEVYPVIISDGSHKVCYHIC